MSIEETNGITTITADEGYFLTNNNGIFGETIILGSDDSPENYTQLPLSELPEETNDDMGETTEEQQALESEKERKIEEIEAYDTSDNVNGFFYNGQFMWLDRITRAVLANTISSAELLGQETINIWYNDTICITLDCENAKFMLASLELYATSCYNITATHKAAIRNMTKIEDIINFDITADYPNRLEFTTI